MGNQSQVCRDSKTQGTRGLKVRVLLAAENAVWTSPDANFGAVVNLVGLWGW